MEVRPADADAAVPPAGAQLDVRKVTEADPSSNRGNRHAEVVGNLGDGEQAVRGIFHLILRGKGKCDPAKRFFVIIPEYSRALQCLMARWQIAGAREGGKMLDEGPHLDGTVS